MRVVGEGAEEAILAEDKEAVLGETRGGEEVADLWAEDVMHGVLPGDDDLGGFDGGGRGRGGVQKTFRRDWGLIRWCRRRFG